MKSTESSGTRASIRKNRRGVAVGLCLVGALAAYGCSDESQSVPAGGPTPTRVRPQVDVTAVSAEQAGNQLDEFPAEAERLSAQLEVRGKDLVASFVNLTDVAGKLSLSTMVENATGLHLTEGAGTKEFSPGESFEVVLSPGAVNGLDGMVGEWLDARVNFEYELESGERGGAPLSVFVEAGRAAPQREVISSGKAFGFPELPSVPSGLVDKQAGTFQMCFANVVTHSGVTENNLDYHRNPTQMVFAAGMRLSVRQPDGTVPPNRFLDSQGCTSLPRQTGTWTFALGLAGQNFPVTGVNITAKKTDGTTPNRQVSTVIDANFAPPRLSVTMAAGEDAQLQTAYAVILHTLLRATSLGAVVRASNLTLQMGTATNYTHSTRTLQVTPTSALQRSSVSHETGHFIHRQWQATGQDLTYCAAGTADCTPPAADDCQRTPNGTHGFRTVEWNSSAHIEGLANFFTAIAFNNATNGADCFIPDNSGLSCETVGKTLESGLTGNGPCFEWFDNKFFDTAVELDWTKMYWDFVADEGQNFVTYLTNESTRTSWTKKNHSSKIFEGLSATMNSALRRAAIGNIQEGAAH